MRRSLGVVLVSTIALGGVVMVVSAVGARTLVPYAVHGRVADLDERNHNSGGSDVWLLQMEDGRDYFIDVVPARTIDPDFDEAAPALRIDKEAWSREIRIDGHPRRVGASRDVVGPIVWALAVAALTIGVAVLRPGSRRARASDPSEPATSR